MDQSDQSDSPAQAGMLKTQQTVSKEGSAWRRYQDVMVGSRSLWRTLYYELCVWLAPVPGGLGLILRKVFWPRLFGSCGRGVQFALGITLRQPHRMHLGARVIISEHCVLDGRNEDTDRAITLEDDVILSAFGVVKVKGSRIRVGARTGIGPHAELIATDGSDVDIGTDVLIGPRVTIVGGGEYRLDRLDVPIWRQGIKPDGAVRIDDNVWLGGGVAVLGGTRIGTGSVVAAGAVVRGTIGPFVICGGIPARTIRQRGPMRGDAPEGSP